MDVTDRKAYEQYQISCANAMDLLADQYQEDIEQGIKRANRENARKTKQRGLALAIIAEITRLNQAEILVL